jgi:alkylhydroperoxidase family enzyme
MAQITLPEGPEEEIYRVWALNPELGAAIGNLSGVVYGAGELSVREREVARMRIAQINDCPV